MATVANYSTLITNAAANNPPCTPAQLSSIIGVETGGQTGLTSPTGVQGIAQITQDTWTSVYGPNVPYSTDPAAQLDCASKLIADYDVTYGNNMNLVAAAYNGGPGVANLAASYMRADPSLSSVDAINMASSQVYANNPAKQTEISNYISRVNGQGNPNRNYGDQPTGGPDDSNPTAYVPVQGSLIDPNQLDNVLATINPPLYDYEGLSMTPWYSDPSIIRNMASTKGTDSPITFKMNFSRNGDASGLMSESSGKPITLKLKASIQDFEKSIKHVAGVTPTRTATLVNLWGMNADTIIGRGSTGLFQNIHGVTDYMSGVGLSNGQQITADNLRVAGKDAFIELLSCFKTNGVVWYKGDKGLNPAVNQVGADAWSSVTGATSYEINARNNDVWARGSVIMTFRNSQYRGFFNSLTWTMDANKPFSWSFSFVFQVEKTFTNVYLPQTNSMLKPNV